MTPPARSGEHVTPSHSPGVPSRAPKYGHQVGETDVVTDMAVRRIDFGYVVVPGAPDTRDAPHALPCLGTRSEEAGTLGPTTATADRNGLRTLTANIQLMIRYTAGSVC
jgi:hypothetical protein